MNSPSPGLTIRPKGSALRNSGTDSVEGYLTIYISNPLTGLPDILPFFPSRRHTDNQIAAIVHRFARDMPKPTKEAAKDLKAYAMAFIKKHINVISPDDVPTFAVWLEGTPYPPSRKKYLAELRHNMTSLCPTFAKSKSFVKLEGYKKPKHPRGINSPDDLAKTLYGNLIHALDKNLFRLKWFVKGQNPAEWPARM